ncbi:hypothetical protein O9H85_11120 [Paenibacillus filicis]|uniref:Helicase XPB/Ssl2 N-terminal domain-containing protein n=1 Tax=Paenibacillus gyeongsangnamensis TaxID=3388067 RepID=A0ABT4Q7V9_9BACL|nr:hypothetical protein [Paenibacillus filicis]MCZ8512960.1 hypothetical protein [Paenibacillus filicis]
MNLADMLSYADIHDLSRIATTYECECNGHSKNELIQSILSTVGRRDVFQNQVDALTIQDIRFLNSLLFDPRGAFSLEELIARVQQSKFDTDASEDGGGNPRETITRFKQRGWLFNGHSQQTRYLFHVPADLKRRFIAALGTQLASMVQPAEEPEAYRDEQKLIVEDIWHFLHYLKENETLLTAENAMYKRSLLQILDRLGVGEEPVGKTAWRFGYGRMFRDYPNRFSFIYDYCYFQDLITEHHQVLALTEKGQARLGEGQREDPDQVYRFWLKLYRGPIPNLISLVHWVKQLAGAWITADSLRTALEPLIRPFYYDTAGSIMDQRILQMMMHLGLIRVGEDERLGRVLQVTKLGSRLIEGTYVPDEERIVIPFDKR